MKILFVSPEYPFPKPSGGIASYVRDIAQTLSRRGHEIKIISMDDTQVFGTFSHIHHDGDVEVHLLNKSYLGRLPKILENPRFRYLLKWPIPDLALLIPPLATYIYYRQLTRNWQPHLIETHDWQACGFLIHLLNRKVPKILRGGGHVKVIAGNNGSGWTKQYESQHRLERWTARRSTLVVPCSRLLGDDEITDFGIPSQKVHPAHLCVDAESFKQEAPDREPYAGECRVCFVGRLEYRKGVDLLLEAGHRLYARYPNVQYYFIGKDCLDLRDNLTRSHFSADYLRKLHFVGQIPRNEIKKYLLSSDFAVFPSRYEPFGLVALEAMACGLPVIVSSAGGWREAVEDGVTGFIVEPGDVEPLRQAIEKIILLGPERRREMGTRARRIVQERFSAEEIAGKMEAVYMRVLQGRNMKEGFQ
jgi:glycosyltransferase involved in cell wall biosynthesis